MRESFPRWVGGFGTQCGSRRVTVGHGKRRVRLHPVWVRQIWAEALRTFTVEYGDATAGSEWSLDLLDPEHIFSPSI